MEMSKPAEWKPLTVSRSLWVTVRSLVHYMTQRAIQTVNDACDIASTIKGEDGAVERKGDAVRALGIPLLQKFCRYMFQKYFEVLIRCIKRIVVMKSDAHND